MGDTDRGRCHDKGDSMRHGPLAGARRFAYLAFAVLLAGGLVWGLATAFASGASPSPSAGAVTLKIGWTEEPDNLNPFIGYQNETYEIWALNYDLLFGYGDRNQPTLDLASAFPTTQNGGISADGKTWTINIRSGIKWQDGVPLTAADVAFTFNYIVKNQMANFTNSTFGIKSATALDATTVRIVCSRPKADLETMWVPIIPQHIWQHVSPQAASTSYAVKLPLVGSGPFQTVAFKKGSYIHLVRNPNYWGPKPAIDNVYFLIYQDADTMVTDLKSGNIDAAWGIPQAQFSALKSAPVVQGRALWLLQLELPRVQLLRQCGLAGQSGAARLEVPQRPELRGQTSSSSLSSPIRATRSRAPPSSRPASGRTPTTTGSRRPTRPTRFDLAKASQLLTQAGYRLGANGVRLDKQGKPIKLRLYASTDSSQEQSEAKLITGWLRPARPQDHPVGGRPGHPYVRHLQRPRHDVGARLRPRGVELDGLLRPRPDAGVLHDAADRQPRRALLVERPVRRAERAAVVDHRPAGAQDADLADAAAHVPADALDRAHLPRLSRGLQHDEVDRLAADVRRPRAGLQHRGLHRLVSEPAAQDRVGRGWLEPHAADRRRRRGAGRRDRAAVVLLRRRGRTPKRTDGRGGHAASPVSRV